MNLDQVRAFLVLSEELHFGRTAERLYLSQPRVSRLVSGLEQEIGGTLFDRTSRRVAMTPLGSSLRERLAPAYAELVAAINDSKSAARGITGVLRIGVTFSTGVPVLSDLVKSFEARHPNCEVEIGEVDPWQPYAALRRDEVDLICNWLAVEESDLTVGSVLESRERVLAVGRDHRLASRASVSIEDLAEEEVHSPPPSAPRALCNAIIPPRTPLGRTIRRTQVARSVQEVFALVATGKIVHPTMRSLAVFVRSDIIQIPFSDLPPMPLGLIWCRSHENARILAFDHLARGISSETSYLTGATA